MAGELAGKVAVITGGASGIGAATAKLFHQEGAQVVIADIDDDAGRQLAEAIGSGAAYCRCDVSRANEVEALVGHAVEHFGRLDVMFNNAGVSGDMRHIDFLDNDFADFTRVMSVDVLGVMLGCRFAGKVMAAQGGGGAIINTSSTAGFYGGYGLPVYRAAKAGVINFTCNAAIALAPFGVRVNSISPGPIETSMAAAGLDLPPERLERLNRDVMDAMIEMQPLKRYGQPLDIANAAVFLASDRSLQITGQNLAVSGGMGIGDNRDRMVDIGAIIAEAMQS